MGRFRKYVFILFGSFQFLKKNDHKDQIHLVSFSIIRVQFSIHVRLGYAKVSKYCAFHMTSKLAMFGFAQGRSQNWYTINKKSQGCGIPKFTLIVHK
jgi:hypothetical protein